MIDDRTPQSVLSILHGYWLLLRRRKLTVAAVFLPITATVVIGALLMPPSYTARTTVIVKFGREFVYRAAVGDITETSHYRLAEMINSEVEIVRSRDLAEQVILEMGVEAIYPDLLEKDLGPERLLASAVDRFQADVQIMDILESSIIRILFEHEDPRVAAQALNVLVERFKDKHLEVFSDPKRGFITAQLKSFESKLAKSEDELEAFRQAHRVYNLAEQKTLLLNQRVLLDTDFNTTKFAIAELQQRLTFLNGHASAEKTEPPAFVADDRKSLAAQLGELNGVHKATEHRMAELNEELKLFRDRKRSASETLAPHPGMEQYNSLDDTWVRLLDLQLREKELLGNFNGSSRQVVAVRKEIDVVKDFLESRGAYVEDVIEAKIRDELGTLFARRSRVIEQIEQLGSQIMAFEVRQILDALAPLKVRRSRIRQELTEVDEEIKSLDGHEKELRRLQRRLVLDEQNYQVFMGKSEEARILEELDRRKEINITVIERAAPPIRPSSVSKRVRIALGMFVGLFAGVAAAIFREIVKLT